MCCQMTTNIIVLKKRCQMTTNIFPQKVLSIDNHRFDHGKCCQMTTNICSVLKKCCQIPTNNLAVKNGCQMTTIAKTIEIVVK